MKLAMRLPEKNRSGHANDMDPRDEAPAEVIDLASRTAYPVVAGRKGKSDTLGLVAGVAVVGLIGAATLWGLNAGRSGDAQTADEAAAAAIAPPVGAPPPPATYPAELTENLPSANAGAAVPVPGADPAQSAVMSQPVMIQPGTGVNPYASPVLVFDGSTALGAVVAAATAAPPPNEAGGSAGTGGSADFASRIGGVGGGPAVARQDINPATTVATGTMIPAVLETAINTDVPGYVRALVSQDVRSFDGSRVLIPRSSRLVGQYQSGLQAGQTRAYVIWTQLIRPDGVTVALASPGTGFDGTTGLAGDVDTHFFQRFGSAMLLSVISGLTTIASGGASVVLGGGQNAAATALQQDGTRSPTIRVRMGEPIRVYAARHLDFASAPRVR